MHALADSTKTIIIYPKLVLLFTYKPCEFTSFSFTSFTSLHHRSLVDTARGLAIEILRAC
jgi:hypothetical protein